MFHIRITAAILRPILKFIHYLTPIADLLARVWVAKIFLTSGIHKIQNWNTTLMLFQNVYHVPLMSPILAAYIGTGFEIILPILLILGFGGRFVIFVFMIYKIECVLSFPFLCTRAGAPGLANHISWGLLLLLLFCHGSGKLSLDYLLHKRWGHHLD